MARQERVVQDTEWLKNIFRSEWCLEAVRGRTPQFVVFLSVSSLVVCELQFQQLPCDSGSSSVSAPFNAVQFFVSVRGLHQDAAMPGEWWRRNCVQNRWPSSVYARRPWKWWFPRCGSGNAHNTEFRSRCGANWGHKAEWERSRTSLRQKASEKVTQRRQGDERYVDKSSYGRVVKVRQETVDVSRKGTRQKLCAQEEKRRAQFWRRSPRKVASCRRVKPPNLERNGG